jgi:hypothetical protein
VTVVNGTNDDSRDASTRGELDPVGQLEEQTDAVGHLTGGVAHPSVNRDRVDARGVERDRVARRVPGGPDQHLLVLGVGRVAQRGAEPFVAGGPAAVLGWARPLGVDAAHPVPARPENPDLVLPGVPEVVEVGERGGQRGQRDCGLVDLIGATTVLARCPVPGGSGVELVQVAVGPPHAGLQQLVDLGQGAHRGDVEHSQHLRVDIAEPYLQPGRPHAATLDRTTTGRTAPRAVAPELVGPECCSQRGCGTGRALTKKPERARGAPVLGETSRVESFESFVALALEDEGLVVSEAVKFPVTRRTAKAAHSETQTHGFEVDLIGARGDRLVLATVKSFLGSRGVAVEHVTAHGGPVRFHRLYAMLNDQVVRDAVLDGACTRYGYEPE